MATSYQDFMEMSLVRFTSVLSLFWQYLHVSKSLATHNNFKVAFFKYPISSVAQTYIIR